MARSFLASRGRSVTILGRGRQRLAPVFREDVVEAIVQAALDPAAPVGTFELAGPETMTAVEFAHQLNRGPVRVRSMPAWLARLLGRAVPGLAAALVEVMLSDLPPAPAAAATPGRFGIRLGGSKMSGARRFLSAAALPRRSSVPPTSWGQRFAGCCAGSAAVRAGVRFALRLTYAGWCQPVS
jgi:hypothetical protein